MRKKFFLACIFSFFSEMASAGIGDAEYCSPPDNIPFVHNGVTYDYIVQVKGWDLKQYFFYGVSSNPLPVIWSYENDPYHGMPLGENFRLAILSASTDCSGTISNWYVPSDGIYGNLVIYDGEPYFFSGAPDNINYIIRSTIALTGTANIAATSFGQSSTNSSPLSFPIAGYTAYTAPVSSVMDQSTLGTGAVYVAGEDSEVKTFEGEIGNVNPPYSNSTCYKKPDNTAFGTSFNYVGTSGTGGSYYLCYDAHPGYDYPFTQGTDIHAPAAGTLCLATTATQSSGSGSLWRDSQRCPLPSISATSWSGFHTFYIIHTGLNINGSMGDDYMTVFLHSNNLENSVRTAIEQNGYATVASDQFIAEVGGYGLDANGNPSSTAYGNHLHLEVFKWNASTGNWDRVDPYGDGTNNILWTH